MQALLKIAADDTDHISEKSKITRISQVLASVGQIKGDFLRLLLPLLCEVSVGDNNMSAEALALCW